MGKKLDERKQDFFKALNRLEDQGILDEALAPRSTIRCAFKHKLISDGDI